MKKGDKVYWNDPDEELCSGEYTIQSIEGDILFLVNNEDSEVQAFIEVTRKQ